MRPECRSRRRRITDLLAILDDQMIGDGAKAKHADYCKPRVEVELAFIMGKRL